MSETNSSIRIDAAIIARAVVEFQALQAAVKRQSEAALMLIDQGRPVDSSGEAGALLDRVHETAEQTHSLHLVMADLWRAAGCPKEPVS